MPEDLCRLTINEQYFLRLPKICDIDAQAMLECYHDHNVAPFIPDECMPSNLDTCRYKLLSMCEEIKQQSALHWFVVLQKNDLPVGKISFHDWNHFHKRIIVSYQIQSSYWNQGIISAALPILIKFIFSHTDLIHIEAQTLLDNQASIKVLRKAGFALDGILRKYRVYKGTSTDIVFFSYIKDCPYGVTSKKNLAL